MPVNLQPCRVWTFAKSAFMKASFALFTFYIAFPSSCLAQNKTDSLRKLMTVLKDTPRIDCLNEISNAYILAEKKDSAIYFSNLAFNEAKKINYIHGIAVSFSRKCQIAKHFDDDFVQSEMFARQSLNWFNKTTNKKSLDQLYFYLLFNFVAQSKFDEGIYYGKEFYKWAKQQGTIP